MEIWGHRTYFFIYSKDKRKGALSIFLDRKSYFSQGEEKNAVQ